MQTTQAIEPAAKTIRQTLKARGEEHLLGRVERSGLDCRLYAADDTSEATQTLYWAVENMWDDKRAFVVDCGDGQRYVYVDRRRWTQSRPLSVA